MQQNTAHNILSEGPEKVIDLTSFMMAVWFVFVIV
jgi:hypothetical protein